VFPRRYQLWVDCFDPVGVCGCVVPLPSHHSRIPAILYFASKIRQKEMKHNTSIVTQYQKIKKIKKHLKNKKFIRKINAIK
jgi:hypothetical protein